MACGVGNKLTTILCMEEQINLRLSVLISSDGLGINLPEAM